MKGIHNDLANQSLVFPVYGWRSDTISHRSGMLSCIYPQLKNLAIKLEIVSVVCLFISIYKHLFCPSDAESDDESAGDSSVQEPQITSVTVHHSADTSTQ